MFQRVTLTGLFLGRHWGEKDWRRKAAWGAFYAGVDITFALGLALLTVHVFTGKHLLEPAVRGFHCSEMESLLMPYRKSTVGMKHLLVVTLAAPFFIVSAIEALIFFRSKGPNRVGKFFRSATFIYLKYLLAYTLLTVVLEVCKAFFGRLRPHFLSVCGPDWTKFSCRNEEFIDADRIACSGDAKQIRKGRVSFPSGHSAAAAFALTFLAVYLMRLSRYVKIAEIGHIRNVVLPLYTLWSAFTMITRVTDFWHYPTDVLGGALIAIAIVLPPFVGKWTSASEIYQEREIEPEVLKDQ